MVAFGLPEIFQLVAGQRKSGALTIRGDGRGTVFLFSEGMIVDVQPDRQRAQYAAILMKEGDYRCEVSAVRPPPWMTDPLRADVLLMEGMQFLDEYPRIREKFPPGKFQVTRKRNVKIEPMGLPPEERVGG